MNNLTTQLTLDDFGRETARTITGITGNNQSVLTIEQTFALNNQVLTRTTKRDSVTLRDETYEYDERSRLKHWSCKTGTEPPSDRYGNSMIDQVFEMDPLGNITQVTTAFTDGSSNTATYTYGNSPDPFQLLTLTNTHKSYPTSVTPKYDAAGRITEDGIARSFTYDALGRVEHVVNKRTNKSADYAYDAHDRLCKQTRKDTSAEPTYFYYRGDQLVNLAQGTDKKRLFQTSVGFTAQINESGENAGVWLAGTDALGSVLSGGNGEKTENRRYAPYGEEKSGESALALGYTGAFEDSVSEAYPLGNGYRFYIPELMRFNAPDSLSPFGAGGINPYAYCEGDPINKSDPSGHAANWLGGFFGALGGLLLGGLLAPFTAGLSLAVTGAIAGGLAAISIATGVASAFTKGVTHDALESISWITGFADIGYGIGKAAIKLATEAVSLSSGMGTQTGIRAAESAAPVVRFVSQTGEAEAAVSLLGREQDAYGTIKATVNEVENRILYSSSYNQARKVWLANPQESTTPYLQPHRVAQYEAALAKRLPDLSEIGNFNKEIRSTIQSYEGQPLRKVLKSMEKYKTANCSGQALLVTSKLRSLGFDARLAASDLRDHAISIVYQSNRPIAIADAWAGITEPVENLDETLNRIYGTNRFRIAAEGKPYGKLL